jgi:hypothetical protein
MTTPYTDIEKEALILQSVWMHIHEMVNYDIFDKDSPSYEPMFNSQAHRKLFIIFLCDFLSTPERNLFALPQPPHGATEIDRTFLFYLNYVCDNPKLNVKSESIRKPVQEFADWLDTEFVLEKAWFPSIELETDLRIKRITMLKICGDAAKHNFARLGRNVQKIRKIFEQNGHFLDEGQSFLVLPEFFDWFYDNVCSYHGKTIAEYLNNIRWGLFYYLRPEYARSVIKTGPRSYDYKYTYPPDVVSSLGKATYWDLMNAVRTEPFFPLFAVSSILKKGY